MTQVVKMFNVDLISIIIGLYSPRAISGEIIQEIEKYHAHVADLDLGDFYI